MDVWGIVKSIVMNGDFQGAILATIIVIGLSFLLRRKGVFTDNSRKTLTDVVMRIGLPALAFNAFMKDLDMEEFRLNMAVLIFSVLIHVLLILLSHLLFRKKEPIVRNVWRMTLIFGNVSFFSMPILDGVFGSAIAIDENLMLIGFRLFLYSYAFYVMSGEVFHPNRAEIGRAAKKIFLNPIMLATFAGLLIWATQDILPQVTVHGVSCALLRVDKTLPSLYAFVLYLKPLATPVSWILIGVTLGGASFAQAFKDKSVWFLSMMKTVVVPLFTLALVIILKLTGILNLGYYGAIAAVVMMAAPVSTVINAYASDYNHEAYLVSDMCLISTLTAIVMMPVFIVLTELACQLAGIVA